MTTQTAIRGYSYLTPMGPYRSRGRPVYSQRKRNLPYRQGQIRYVNKKRKPIYPTWPKMGSRKSTIKHEQKKHLTTKHTRPWAQSNLATTRRKKDQPLQQVIQTPQARNYSKKTKQLKQHRHKRRAKSVMTIYTTQLIILILL